MQFRVIPRDASACARFDLCYVKIKTRQRGGPSILESGVSGFHHLNGASDPVRTVYDGPLRRNPAT